MPQGTKAMLPESVQDSPVALTTVIVSLLATIGLMGKAAINGLVDLTRRRINGQSVTPSDGIRLLPEWVKEIKEHLHTQTETMATDVHEIAEEMKSVKATMEGCELSLKHMNGTIVETVAAVGAHTATLKAHTKTLENLPCQQVIKSMKCPDGNDQLDAIKNGGE